MGSYLRKLVRGYSSLLAPISDLLRDKRSASKRARRFPVPWGAEQNKDLKALIELFTSPLILALPDWEATFQLHTDASELGTGAVTRGKGDVVGPPASQAVLVGKSIRPVRRLLRAHEAVREPGSLGEAPPVGDQVDGVRHGPPVATGGNHQLPDALSRLPLSDAPGTDIDNSFPDGPSTKTTYRGPGGQVLDGVLLNKLGADGVGKPTGNIAAITVSVGFTPAEQSMQTLRGPP